MWYVMVIISCLNGSCREDTIYPEKNMSVFECMMASQYVAAQWHQTNPKRHIQRIKCKPLEI